VPERREMKIAYVTPEVNHRGATQSCTATLIDAVARRHEVAVYARHIDGLRFRKNIRWVRVPSLSRPFPALLRYLTFLLLSNLMLAADQVVRGQRYDIVHATGGDCFLADILTTHYCQAERLALAKSGRISVDGKGRLASLDILSQWVYMPIVSTIERLMYGRRRLQAVIAVSQGVGRDIDRHYGTKAPILTIPNGVDLQRFHPRNRARWREEVRTELGVEPERFLLCFVGGDWGRKGLATAITALPHLADQRVSLIVVGNGNQTSYLRLAERHGVAERVRFVGQTATTERYLAAADAFLLPSSYEAFSVAVLEAAAAGLPLLVTRINGTEELVIEGTNGFFVAPEPADVAAKVRRLTGDRALADRMGQAARATVEDGYDWQTIEGRTLDVYEGLARDVA
jgi:UDP-glucose:(heptosyl)LPS alpha-1,3-glucosyltransferase